MADNIIGLLAFIFGAFLFGLTAVVFTYYVRKRTGRAGHVAWMAASYLIFAFLPAFSINYRIFTNGTSRTVGIVIYFIGCVFGIVGLYVLTKHRKE